MIAEIPGKKIREMQCEIETTEECEMTVAYIAMTSTLVLAAVGLDEGLSTGTRSLVTKGHVWLDSLIHLLTPSQSGCHLDVCCNSDDLQQVMPKNCRLIYYVDQ